MSTTKKGFQNGSLKFYNLDKLILTLLTKLISMPFALQ